VTTISLGTSLLVAVVGLAAIMVASSFYYRWILERSLFTRLKDLDEIRTSGLPPARWLRKGSPPVWDKRTLRGLKRLRSFVKRTRMVENEDTRALVIDEMNQIIASNR
jgi:hypothetical protein